MLSSLVKKGIEGKEIKTYTLIQYHHINSSVWMWILDIESKLENRIESSEMRCFQRILRIPYTGHFNILSRIHVPKKTKEVLVWEHNILEAEGSYCLFAYCWWLKEVAWSYSEGKDTPQPSDRWAMGMSWTELKYHLPL